jgi:hypothetical protein
MLMAAEEGHLCLYCRYWDAPAAARERAVQQMQGVGSGIRKPETFACRRYPPHPDPRRPSMPQEGHRSNWPMTAPNDWCAEWAVATTTTAAESSPGWAAAMPHDDAPPEMPRTQFRRE